MTVSKLYFQQKTIYSKIVIILKCFCGLIRDYFKSYISNRKQYTIVSSHNSEILVVESGIRTEFIIYLSDVQKKDTICRWQSNQIVIKQAEQH